MNDPSPLEAIFFAALEKGSLQERAAYLDQACGGDADLRRRVEKMLTAQAQAGSFLEQPPRSLELTVDNRPVSEGLGTLIGPYKLLEQIGEGGFGVVFMAEQAQPVRRRVALKVLKPGMDTKQVIARFEAERQALAIMDHPNIARVLDGGATPSGRPFFVMELVRGVSITDYCDQYHLTPRQRLELFIPICQAVQHAHQKGIIHRDLKPSNVLVTMHDTTPVVKVIDFGVAKAMGQELTEKTLFTSFAQMIGTPLYMSPEQAGQSGLDIDTRSDIYSLGVLLYELLTGTTPFPKERFRQAAYDEIRRIIREEDPPKPSTRLSTTEELPSIAAQRGVEPRRLSGMVRGELDWIVMKCLEKDRNRRYETASGLARDIECYLRDEPVLACPPSRWYRFRKFTRRNRGSLTIVATVILAALLAVAGLIVNNRMVRREKELKESALERAVQEKARADENLAQARRAVREYLNKAVANTQQGVADPYLLRKDLLSTAIPFYTEFVRQQQDDPALAAEQGRAYGDLAFLWEELGEWEEARAAHERALAIFARLAAEFPGEASYRHRLASDHFNQGNVHFRLGQQSKAQESYQTALALLERLVADVPAEPRYRQDLAGTYGNLALSLRRMGRLEEALAAYQKASDHQERLAAEHPSQPRTRVVLAGGYMGRASLLNELGRHDEAVSASKRAADLFEKLAGAFPRVSEYREGWAGALNNLSVFLRELGRLDQAVSVHRQAITIQEQLVKDFSSLPVHRQDLADSHTNLGVLLDELGKHEEALACQNRALQILERLASEFPGAPDHRRALALGHTNRGEALRNLGRTEEALAAHRSAVRLQEQLATGVEAVPADLQGLARGQHNLAALLVELGRYDEGLNPLESALSAREKLAAASPTNALYLIELAGSQATMGNLLRDRDRPEAALEWYAKSIGRSEQLLSRDARLIQARLLGRNAHRDRAVALGQLNRHAEALRDHDRALELDDGRQQSSLRMERALTLARMKEIARALMAADPLAANPNADARTLYTGAAIFALASAAMAEQTDRHASRAVALLRRAVEMGYKDLASLKKDEDLDPLRVRDDFKRLLAGLESRKQ